MSQDPILKQVAESATPKGQKQLSGPIRGIIRLTRFLRLEDSD